MNERSPLLLEADLNELPPRPLWRRGTLALAKSLKNVTNEITQRPIAIFLGLTTSIQSVINAFVNPSDTEPKDISVKWWNHLSLGIKIQSCLSLIFAVYVNFPVNKRFIQQAVQKIKTNAQNMCKSAFDFFDNSTSLFLGFNSGIAAGAITFAACLWMGGGLILPALFGVLSFIFASASRYMGAKMIWNLIRIFFNPDAKQQQKTIDALKHLKMDYHLQLNQLQENLETILQRVINQKADELLYATAHAPSAQLNEHDYHVLLQELVNKIVELENLHPEHLDNSFFNEKEKKEYLVEYIRIVSRVVFALVFGVTGGAIYMQKGFDGYNILSTYLFHFDLLKLNIWLQRFIGAFSGLGSGLLYATSAAAFIDLFSNLLSYLYYHPQHIFAALSLFVANYYSAGSMHSVTSSVLKQKHLIGWLAEGEMKKVLPYLVRGGCCFVNLMGELNKYFVMSNPNRPTPKEIIAYFDDPAKHLVEPEVAAICSFANHRLSFFHRPRPKNLIDIELQNIPRPR